VLKIQDLTVSFLRRTASGQSRSVPAVRGVSLAVEDGSFTALVGESGSGKSVTALSICRLLNPFHASGSIFWDLGDEQTDLMRQSAEELRKIRGSQISYIFQDPAASLNPVLKVGPQIDEAVLAHADLRPATVKERTRSLLSALKISDPGRCYESYPHELSGGMKQRAMIAMALAAGPRLLVADEPTTALDVSVEAEIVKLLQTIQKERSLAIFFITHNLTLATACAETVYVMRQGSIVERLLKGDAFHAQEEYTRKLFATDLRKATPKQFIETGRASL
jgi:ABC-type dipeptide/oligopeptide/nickel transport system ATPase component